MYYRTTKPVDALLHSKIAEAKEKNVTLSADVKISDSVAVKPVDKLNHGLGTGIIKSAAEKYGGSVFCEVSGDSFIYIVSIPLKKEA